MANPVLNEKAFDQAVVRGEGGPAPTEAGWAAPTAAGPAPAAPVRDTGDVMTMRGTISASAALFALLVAAAAVGWTLVPTQTNVLGEQEVTGFPAWIIVNVLIGFGLVVVASFKPRLARFLGPLYAICEGLFVGAISKVYEAAFDGIVVQAVGATIAVFATMLFLYGLRIIKVTERMRSIVMTATIGIAAFYFVALLINLFGGSVSFISSASWLGIGFSVLVAGLAAFNLLLDFDIIERGVAQRAPAYMEWFAGLGLLVTVVWLYLELLRLLSKLQSR